MAREVCMGMEPLQAQAARYILADVPAIASSSTTSPPSMPVVTWIDLTTRLPVPEHEAIHDLAAAASRLAAAAASAPVPPPSDVRLCVTGTALAHMWESNV